MVLRHEKGVMTQNSIKGKTVKSRHEIVVATQTPGHQKKLSRRGSNWLTIETVLWQRNFVATHNLAKEEKARSRHNYLET